MKIILSTVVAVAMLTGCSKITNNPVTKSAKSATNSVVDSAKGATAKVANSAKDVTNTAKTEEVTKATSETSLKDKAIDKAVDVADEKTDGAASKVIDAVK